MTSTPSICLCMIVKDEAHVVLETLTCVVPYLDYWVIVDTGSSDSTVELIQTFFDRHGVPGELHERPWKDFGSNRTEALELCRDRAEYAWMIDADDLVVGTLDLSGLTHDCYLLRYGPDLVYWRRQIFRASLRWRYVGVLHEHPVCDDECSEATLEGAYHVVSRRLGSRNRADDKYQRDAELLLAELQRDPSNERNVFYLAQSYLDADEPRRALHYFTLRIHMGGWQEEVFAAALRRAQCLQQLDDPWAHVQQAYLECWQLRPSRAEPLYQIARHHRESSQFNLGLLFAEAADQIPLPDGDVLFVQADVYEWRVADEIAICSYYLGQHRRAFELWSELLRDPALGAADRQHLLTNRDFAVPHIVDDMTGYPQAVVERLVRRRRPAAPRVTLSMTSCKRPDLLDRTVCSFLNCCADVDLIDRWICVDDGSDAADLARLEQRFPFIEVVRKSETERGHANSMNRILELIDSPYWLHLEDDWQFFVRDCYVGTALEILDHDPQVGQVLFNRNYGETLEGREISGGRFRRTSSGVAYRLHEHVPVGTEEYDALFDALEPGAVSVAYWPHYSLRPSLVRMEAIREIGPYDATSGHFELELARRYARTGWVSAFFDTTCCLHLGSLTTDRGNPHRLSAYQLNQQRQFGEVISRPRWRMALIQGGASSVDLADRGRQEEGSLGQDDVELVQDTADADYVVVLGSPPDGLDPSRSIVISSAPDEARRLIRDRRYVQIRCHSCPPQVGELLPVLRRVASGHELASRLSVRVLNLERRPDRWHAVRANIEAACSRSMVGRCQRRPVYDARGLSLAPELQRLFRLPSLTSRRRQLGYALSHVEVWREAAASRAACLVLEDDVRLADGFENLLVEVCGQLVEIYPHYHVALLEYEAWGGCREPVLDPSFLARVVPMDWTSFVGGSRAYIVSPKGAAWLLALVDRDGIELSIEHFLQVKASELTVLRAVPQLVGAREPCSPTHDTEVPGEHRPAVSTVAGAD